MRDEYMWQSWCDWCYAPLIIGKYEEVNGRFLCDKCNPNKLKEVVYVCVPKDKEQKDV